MKSFTFEIKQRSPVSKTRLGTIHTPHGDIETPAFVPVGTKATVKSLIPSEISNLGYNLHFVNTYHMLVHPGPEVVKKAGGLHKFMNWDNCLITDSGGFQVFSLASVILKKNEHGVLFRDHYSGQTIDLTPRFSIETQRSLGADIILPLDDCTPYPVTEKKAQKSLALTQNWFLQSYETYKQTTSVTKKHQALYKIIQGSLFENLRKESIKFYRDNNIETDGWAIGGVSVGESKPDIYDITNVCMDLITGDNQPVHLLGVGEVDDVFDILHAGIDTFDCVQPTRLARMGMAYNFSIPKYSFSIEEMKYKEDFNPLDSQCGCYTCTHHSRSYIHHLFKMKELTGYRLITIHNLFMMQKLVQSIRIAVINNTWEAIYHQFKHDEFTDLHKIFN
ncbi:MAG: tRNA guanosine(34) transglycosylase Tgt [Patescibacteria group bacterium]|jgi:queuine tRNA-ribosyltransferase